MLNLLKVIMKTWVTLFIINIILVSFTAQKMKFSIKNFVSKFNQIRSFRRIWSHLLKKSLMKNFIYCAVFTVNFEHSQHVNQVFSCWFKPFYVNVPFYTPWKHSQGMQKRTLIWKSEACTCQLRISNFRIYLHNYGTLSNPSCAVHFTKL